jgi:hypothetical protein
MPRAVLVALSIALGGCAALPRRPAAAGALRFTCTPADAHIVLDEDDLGPCVVWGSRWLGLVRGTHRLQVVRDGYFPEESEVTADGSRRSVQVTLRRIPE